MSRASDILSAATPLSSDVLMALSDLAHPTTTSSSVVVACLRGVDIANWLVGRGYDADLESAEERLRIWTERRVVELIGQSEVPVYHEVVGLPDVGVNR